MAHYELDLDGSHYKFDFTRDMTIGMLRNIKSWFPELGSYLKLNQGLADLDPEAVLCLIWAMKKDAGEKNIPEPNAMNDISFGELFDTFKYVPDADDEETANDPLSGDNPSTSTESEPT